MSEHQLIGIACGSLLISAVIAWIAYLVGNMRGYSEGYGAGSELVERVERRAVRDGVAEYSSDDGEFRFKSKGDIASEFIDECVSKQEGDW